MTSLIGKSAVVTGGCSGIGCEVVKKFLEGGIKNVAILDICDTRNISQSLQSAYKGQKVVFIQTDVSKKDQVKRAFDEIIKLFGYIDIVVGNAGILSETDYERVINVNLLGILNSTYTAIELMSKEKGGHGGTVINVASVAALDVYSNMPVYSASKHGIIGWHRCFSDEYYYEKHGIKFMAICPGPTDTQIIVDYDNKVNFGTLEGSDFKFQPPTIVAQGILDTLNLSKNGSIYIIDDGKMKEVISFNVDTSPEVVIKVD